MRKLKFIITFLFGIVITLNSFVMATDVMAGVVYEPVTVTVPFTANGGDTVTIESLDGSYQDSVTLPSARTEKESGKFDLSFNEPDTYEYILKDGTKELSVKIFIYDEGSAALAANVSVYDANGTKVDSANFYESTYVELILDTEGEGSATGDGIYLHGTSVTVTAIPDAKNTFTGWKDEEGNIVSTDLEYTFTIDGTSADVYRLTAVFKKVPPIIGTGEKIGASSIAGAILVLCAVLFFAIGGTQHET